LKSLLEHAADVGVIDLAACIIANPRRARVSLAGELALALAVKQFWLICLEADILVHALALPETTDDGRADTARADMIAAQAATIQTHLAALRGDQSQE